MFQQGGATSQQGKRGWMFTREPLRTLGRDWEIDVEYRVHGKGMTYFGDGFAMWYTPERYVSGSGTAEAHVNATRSPAYDMCRVWCGVCCGADTCICFYVSVSTS